MFFTLAFFACSDPGVDTATSSSRGGQTLGDSDAFSDDTDPGTASGGDDAALVSATFPTSLVCGESAEAVVTFQNTGETDWTRDESYKLGAIDDADDLITGDVRIWLDEGDLSPPGGEHAFVISLIAPTDSEGDYVSDWQMVREGVHWFGEQTAGEIAISCDESAWEDLPLPDMSDVVDQLAAEHPDMLADSCLEVGGSWDFLDTLVDELRTYDERWGYNWKRGVVGDASQDVVDYHYGQGDAEGSTDVYIIDVIVNHCSNAPEPGWLDQTQATADAGTIGMWTGRGRF